MPTCDNSKDDSLQEFMLGVAISIKQVAVFVIRVAVFVIRVAVFVNWQVGVVVKQVSGNLVSDDQRKSHNDKLKNGLKVELTYNVDDLK